MLEKALVFGIQNGVDELWRNVLVPNGHQPLAIFLDKTVVTAQNSKWRFQGDIGERRNFRNLWIEIKKGARESHRYGEEKRCHEPP